MRRIYVPLLAVLGALLFTALPTYANLADYGFSVGQGGWLKSETTTILKAGSNDDASAVNDIGFTFYFDGQPYTQFSVSSNGLIGLGSQQVTPCWLNQLTTPSGECDGTGGYDFTLANVPHIAPFWDDLRIPDSRNDGFDSDISYGLIGEAPNRILVINFRDIETDYFNFNYSSFQVRLYETSNTIEFFYSYLNPSYSGNGASIGLAISDRNYLSVSPAFEGAYVNGQEVNDSYYPSEPSIPEGTMYTFRPCQITFTGNVDEGGTSSMANGDVLLVGKQAMVYSYASYIPFSMTMDGACSSRVVTASIVGPDASDYSFSPENFTLYAGNEPTQAYVGFHPTGIGVRHATLELVDDHGTTYSFELAAEGLPRIIYIGDVNQGGTDGMASGDVLMTNVHVHRNESGTFTPFALQNISEEKESQAAAVSYWIKGISGGQYSIDPPNTSIGSGDSHTPTITFAPTTVGPVLDSLFVTADGQTRAFALLATGDGVGAEFIAGNEKLHDSSTLFVNSYSCSGSGPITIAVRVRNIGNQPMNITGADFYITDSVYQQGSPRYPLLWGNQESPERSNDYIITEHPPVLPITGAQASFPITVETGTTKVIYFTFISQQPGKRFARAFVHTDAENFSSHGMYGQSIEGLLTLDLFGRGIGGNLSDNAAGGVPKSILMPATKVGQSTDATVNLFNVGTCDLRIAMNSFRFTADDADEYTVTSLPLGTLDPATNDLVLAPGQSTSFQVRFTPSQLGSRRATMHLQTNDSSYIIPGITERGGYYLDFYGNVGNGIMVNGINFGTVLATGSSVGTLDATAAIVNVTNAPVTITKLEITGADAASFTPGTGGAWTTPLVIAPNTVHTLPVHFAPTSNTTGLRTAELVATTDDGNVINGTLSGMVGTRTLTASATDLSFAVGVGRTQRRSVTIANNGTLPVQITSVTVEGTDKGSYTVLPLERTTLIPGQSELVELAFRPTATGATTATLVITSNSTDGAINVTLNGMARTARPVDDPSATTGAITGRADELAHSASDLVSGLASETTLNGVALQASVPNPVRDVATIGYTVPSRGNVLIELFDATGALVRVVESGAREAGSYSVQVDVRNLASGVYHYRLTANGVRLARTMNVVR